MDSDFLPSKGNHFEVKRRQKVTKKTKNDKRVFTSSGEICHFLKFLNVNFDEFNISQIVQFWFLANFKVSKLKF